jgi:integrase
MARQVNRLSVLKVRALNEPGLHADGNGLYMSASRTGSKSWVLIYKRNGKRTELGLGPVHAVPLAQARDKAQEAAALRAQGIDPQRHWKGAVTASEAATFGQVAKQFIEDHEGEWKNAKHRQQWTNTLTTYCGELWDRPVDEVVVDDVLAILRPIWTRKPETASRLRQRIERVLDAAKVLGMRSGENPAAWRGNLALLLAKRRKGPKQHHRALPYDEVPAFMRELRCAKGVAGRALEFLVHTAARTSEVLNATWKEVDLEAKVWTVPAERMKAGKVHRVPLSEPVMTLLSALPHGSEYLFPSPDPSKPLSKMAMTAVLKRMKMLERCTVHGFRSSFRDWCGEATSFARELAEQALAHQVGNEVERAYRRGDALERRRELMEAWSEFIAGGPS